MAAASIVKSIPTQLLKLVVSDEHIGLLAFNMEDWEMCAPILGLKQADVDSIKADHKGHQLQAQKSLFRWREIQGFKATNHRLIVSLCTAERADLAERLQGLLLHLPSDSAASKKDYLERYRLYLQDCYASSFDHPSRTQWPFFVLQSYVDLSLFDVPTTNKSPGDTQENTRKPIELCDLFQAGNYQAKRKVLLLEGVAGSGKTTLSWHSCKQWAAGELFQHIRLLIHLSLNDPDVASAKCLADIIPHSSKKMREKVAEAIEEKDGEGVCFFFDACDEAPDSLWKSFLQQFLEGKSRSTLHKCSIVMAARPEIHHKCLSQLLTARVHIQGFESSNLEKYFDSSLLNSDPTLRWQLDEALKINPELVGLCGLPINAAILVHLYNFLKDNLPSTTTGLFKPLVLNLLLRYIQHTRKEQPEITDFSSLPKEDKPKFNAICKLAFSAIMTQTRIFSEDRLKESGLGKTEGMGFLQLHQQLTAFGSSNRYSFLHLSLQEFLAAVHITQMSGKEQVAAIQGVLQKTPLSPVLPFYAGLTKLSNGDAFNMLLKVAEAPLDTNSVFLNITSFADDKRRLFLALINCIYETQQPALVDQIAPPSPAIKLCDQTQISLFGLPLNSLDCLSIGFFLGNTTNKWMELLFCSISDTGLQVLVRQIKVNHSARNAIPTNCVNMSFNAFSEHTAPLVKDMLVTLKGIGICRCWNTPESFMRFTIEGVCNNSNLQILNLGYCNLDSSHVNHLILLLITARNLQELYLDGNSIGWIMDLISEALKLSKIRRLSLENCQIYSADLRYLTDATSRSRYLELLFINSNHFRPSALTDFLQVLLDNSNTTLECLKIDELNDEQRSLIQQINWNRTQKGSTKPLLPMHSNLNFRDTLRNSILTDMSNAYSKNPQLQKREECY